MALGSVPDSAEHGGREVDDLGTELLQLQKCPNPLAVARVLSFKQRLQVRLKGHLPLVQIRLTRKNGKGFRGQLWKLSKAICEQVLIQRVKRAVALVD